MIKFIKNFRKDEDGAVTVDWVVLTAAVVGLAAVAYTQIGNGTEAIADAVGSTLSAAASNVADDIPINPDSND
ncbi:Flp family type IVb pilin [Ruegeria sp. MALMAid1280]|uniref:Flp family type IVb pilin n=1 Tax=Ruegeria sp. MALMAid1280 TaxID=3411634 RepID=UPI003BA0CC92